MSGVILTRWPPPSLPLQTEVNTFYDPVCGVPLFRAPVNRSFADFKADTVANFWPSFRAEEATEHVKVSPSGRAFSSCGTHLGDFMPDAKGARYCIDLTCISGHPAQ